LAHGKETKEGRKLMSNKTPEETAEQIDPNAKGKYYKDTFQMNTVGKNRSVVTTAIPKMVIRKAAEAKSLSVKEFVDTHQVIAMYNNFDGIFYTFEERTSKQKES